MSEMEWRSRAIRELFKRTEHVAHWAPGLEPGNGEPVMRGAATWLLDYAVGWGAGHYSPFPLDGHHLQEGHERIIARGSD